MLKLLRNEPMKLVYILCITLAVLTIFKDYYLGRFYYISFDILWVGALVFITKWQGVFDKK